MSAPRSLALATFELEATKLASVIPVLPVFSVNTKLPKSTPQQVGGLLDDVISHALRDLLLAFVLDVDARCSLESTSRPVAGVFLRMIDVAVRR